MPSIIPTGAASSGAGDTTATVPPAPAAPVQPGELAQPVSTLPAAAPAFPLERTDQTLDDLRKQSFGSKVYHGIMNALGGSQDVTFERDPMSGKMITHMTPSTPGMQWKRIISGALTGFAGAQEAGTQGPGGTMRGFAGGVRAGIQGREQTEKTMRSQADEDYKSQLETAKNNLSTSLLQQEIFKTSLEVQHLNDQAQDHDIEMSNAFHQAIQDGGPNSQIVGTFPDEASAMKYGVDHPEAMKKFVGGHWRFMPNIVNGKRDGLVAAVITPNFEDTPIPRDYHLPMKETREGPDGQPEEFTSSFTIPAGTKMGKAFAMMQVLQKEFDQSEYHNLLGQAAKTRAGAAVTTSQAALQRASAAGVAASAAYMNAQTRANESPSRIDYNMARAAAAEDAAGDPNIDWGNGGYKEFSKWNNKWVEPVTHGIEKTYELADEAYKAFQEQQRTGQPSKTGAASMQMFANHMQLTFGQVKGMRQGQQMMEQHLGARSLSGSAEVAFNKLVNGDVLTPEQWTDFHTLIENNRNKTWDGILRDADVAGRPYQYIAFPDDYRAAHKMAPLQRAVPRQPAPAAVPAATPPAPATTPAANAPQGGGGPPPPRQKWSKSAWAAKNPGKDVAAAAALAAKSYEVVD